MELTRANIEAVVGEAIMHYAETIPTDVTPQTTLDELGYDSLSKVEAVMKVEAAAGVDIDDDVLESWNGTTSIQEAIDSVARALGVH